VNQKRLVDLRQPHFGGSYNSEFNNTGRKQRTTMKLIRYRL